MRTSTRQPSSVTDRRDTPFFNGLLAWVKLSDSFIKLAPQKSLNSN
jgi:hypothetical protein